ncbi:MAG TPA: hypothetical protein VEK13_04385 [Thermoplasmata archaeon]|nr:hypothetical protein [Thermoplasmata archaeon]
MAGIRANWGRPTLWRKGGPSDLNLAVRAWGMPSSAYGPGDPRLDHTDRERISVTEIRRAVGALEIALERLRSSPVTPRGLAAGA